MDYFMEYAIKRIIEDFAVDGAPAKKAWRNAERLAITNWPWHDYSKYPIPKATAKCLYSDSGIYLFFEVKEMYIQAKHTEYQSRVFQDSCVEFFAAPNEKGYFNFEINCIGTLLLHWNEPDDTNRLEIPLEDIKNLKIVSSLGAEAITKPRLCPETGYWVECFLPFSIFTKYTGIKVPASGDFWRANFFKCGDKTSEPSWGSWSPVKQPKPSFHHPEYFGKIIFK
jgi:hypothetical protein